MSQVSWDIANMERHLPGDAVYTVHWTASLDEDGETASSYGSIGLGDPDPTNFIPFKNLTKKQVVEWVLAALGVDQVVSLEEALYSQIQSKIHPTSEAGVPW